MSGTIKDYLSTTASTADYAYNLDVSPQEVLTEIGEKKQVVLRGDDRADTIISFSDDSIFYISLLWKTISETDMATIFDFFHDTTKANQFVNSFYFPHPTDGNTYVVRFASTLKKSVYPAYYGFDEVKLKVLGWKA